MTDQICKTCGESLWIHKELDYSGTWLPGDTCEEFVKTEVLESNETS